MCPLKFSQAILNLTSEIGSIPGPKDGIYSIWIRVYTNSFVYSKVRILKNQYIWTTSVCAVRQNGLNQLLCKGEKLIIKTHSIKYLACVVLMEIYWLGEWLISTFSCLSWTSLTYQSSSNELWRNKDAGFHTFAWDSKKALQSALNCMAAGISV